MNDVAWNKKERIERCVEQVRRYYALPSMAPFTEDFLRQDAIAVNIKRACEAAIDLANHLIKVRKLGLPKQSRDSFAVLVRENLISRELSGKLLGMVGFRNILVHEYTRLYITLMVKVIEERLDDLIEFSTLAVRLDTERSC